jgi:ssDNA-binding Zn-finger/Zn-ribbon topoisomerase 1
MIPRVTGPECDRCGCADSRLLESFTRWGQGYERRQCEHCGRTYQAKTTAANRTEPIVKPVVYQVIRCPGCGSGDTHVTSTRRPIRHHKCDGCGECFKSSEGS